ncbi:MAG TPA: DNA polymerase III subunit gamma/tau [Patescibacteria group bacterium]|nr:DNA polymerase III subunit gamma/tau [Patescibacteria group bacterium]
MVYYRKYRPQNISELDLPGVREKLTAILSAKDIPHAFLFTGPKGLGKTSSARILAKAINCEKRQLSVVSGHSSNIEPCNNCDACKSITNGSNLDVIEIDAASNRGIDEIRDLRDKIKYAPVALPKKVYIIDEVHMLTNDAFNALLKTLEEPPSHAIFILCTTEIEKVPQTIVSRAFHITFQKPSKEELLRSLNRIVQGEKLDIEDGVLERVVELADGAFRDAAKILEELVLASNGARITNEIVEKNYKSQSIESNVGELLKFLSKKDVNGALSVIDTMANQGSDFKIVTEKLAQKLHAQIMDMENSKLFSKTDLKNLLNLVNNSYKDIKFSVLPQIPLEIAVIDWIIGGDENVVVEAEGEVKHEIPIRVEEKPKEILEKKSEAKVEVQASSAKIQNTPQNEIRNTTDDKHADMFHSNAKTDHFMSAFLAALKQENHSVIGILRGCQLVGIEEGKVKFTTKYKFHRDKLNEPKMADLLNRRASEILKENIQVSVDMT